MIEASLSMGASTLQVVYKVLVPEALPSLIFGAAIATTTILGYSAMSGFVGGGGLGTIRYQLWILPFTIRCHASHGCPSGVDCTNLPGNRNLDFKKM